MYPVMSSDLTDRIVNDYEFAPSGVRATVVAVPGGVEIRRFDGASKFYPETD